MNFSKIYGMVVVKSIRNHITVVSGPVLGTGLSL